jgi:hypothetical protein
MKNHDHDVLVRLPSIAPSIAASEALVKASRHLIDQTDEHLLQSDGDLIQLETELKRQLQGLLGPAEDPGVARTG